MDSCGQGWRLGKDVTIPDWKTAVHASRTTLSERRVVSYHLYIVYDGLDIDSSDFLFR